MGIFALIGALKSREKELNDTLEISGCSAGSILTLFLALGMNIDKILDTCLNVDIESLVTLSISSFISNYGFVNIQTVSCLLYTSPSPRDLSTSRMPSSA